MLFPFFARKKKPQLIHLAACYALPFPVSLFCSGLTPWILSPGSITPMCICPWGCSLWGVGSHGWAGGFSSGFMGSRENAGMSHRARSAGWVGAPALGCTFARGFLTTVTTMPTAPKTGQDSTSDSTTFSKVCPWQECNNLHDVTDNYQSCRL